MRTTTIVLKPNRKTTENYSQSCRLLIHTQLGNCTKHSKTRSTLIYGRMRINDLE